MACTLETLWTNTVGILEKSYVKSCYGQTDERLRSLHRLTFARHESQKISLGCTPCSESNIDRRKLIASFSDEKELHDVITKGSDVITTYDLTFDFIIADFTLSVAYDTCQIVHQKIILFNVVTHFGFLLLNMVTYTIQ